MQIHELNGYTGALDDAYMAVDDGSDTGKKKIKDITDPLNARIDNIIAGGDAPSAAEIIDARLGANGKTYASLGDAIRDQVSDLKDATDSIAYVKTNLFDKDNATVGKYISNGSEITLSSALCSDFIPAGPNETFIVPYSPTVGVSPIQMYKADKTWLAEGAGTRDGDFVVYTTGSSSLISYIRINNSLSAIDTMMIVRGSAYPPVYIPYNSTILKTDIPLSETQEDQVNDKINILSKELPNMINKADSDLLNGYFSSSFYANSNYRMTHPILVEANVQYVYPQSASMGANTQVPVWANGSFTGAYETGTLTDGIVTFTATRTQYIRANIGNVYALDNFFFMKKSEYDDKFVPYGRKTADTFFPNDNFNTPNLFNKRVVFDGDSICYGAADTIGGEAYAARIGKANSMAWANVGVSGGTIAVVAGVSHNLCTYIDTIHTNYPDLDYLILEGGTNDADRLGTAGLGTLTDMQDYSGSYDTSTFIGALETLFYKATGYYPYAKIGFIIAPKMAAWSPSQNKMLLPIGRATFFDAVPEVCEKWGIPYINLWKGCAMNPCSLQYYDHSMTEAQNLENGKAYADGQHPNANGYDYIYPIIANWMNTL